MDRRTHFILDNDICSRRQFQFCLIFKKLYDLIFHVNHLLADDSHDISSLIFLENEIKNHKGQ